jgi:transcriptional/translational regulatory protein YebC/TACO1
MMGKIYTKTGGTITTGGTINITSTPKSKDLFDDIINSRALKMNVNFNIVFKVKDFKKVNRILHSLTYSVDDESFHLIYKDATYAYDDKGSIVENSIESICFYRDSNVFIIQEQIKKALKGFAIIKNFRMYQN